MGSINIGSLDFCFTVDFGFFRHKRGAMGQYYRRRAYFDNFFMGNLRQKSVFRLSALLIKNG